mmetsp:Transcript_9438/g.22732  ORF Transcript_9438/g.22732 Transcript_9438/m.22732 type:complete len:239 (-) Transcript_9438:1436-2152(-)
MDLRKLILILEEELSDRTLKEGVRQPLRTLLDHLGKGVDGPVDLFPHGLRGFLKKLVHILLRQADPRVAAQPSAKAGVGVVLVDAAAASVHQAAELLEAKNFVFVLVVLLKDEVASRAELDSRNSLDRLPLRLGLRVLFLVWKLRDWRGERRAFLRRSWSKLIDLRLLGARLGLHFLRLSHKQLALSNKREPLHVRCRRKLHALDPRGCRSRTLRGNLVEHEVGVFADPLNIHGRVRQ